MIPNKYITWGNSGAIIRELAAYGAQRAKAVGPENVYDFTIGSPSIEPPKKFLDTVDELMKTVSPIELHTYAPAAGLESVRNAVAGYLADSFGVEYSPDDIYMTHGASSALAIILAALLSEGEDALVLAPYFPEYRIYVEQAGGRLIEVPCDADFQTDLDALEKRLTPKTSVLIINSPNNPSGAVLSESSVKAISELLNRKAAEYGHPIYIVADEPYRELVYGDIEVPFIPAFYDNTIYCYSFSKSLSLPGERIGYLAVSPKAEAHDDIRAAVNGAGRALGYVCVSTMFQLAAAQCLGVTVDISKYDNNRLLAYTSLKDMGFTCVKPDGAFYLFIKAPDGDSQGFCRKAMEKDILLVPGDAFGCPGYARLAYCVSNERIRRSLPAFKALAEEYGL